MAVMEKSAFSIMPHSNAEPYPERERFGNAEQNPYPKISMPRPFAGRVGDLSKILSWTLVRALLFVGNSAHPSVKQSNSSPG